MLFSVQRLCIQKLVFIVELIFLGQGRALESLKIIFASKFVFGECVSAPKRNAKTKHVFYSSGFDDARERVRGTFASIGLNLLFVNFQLLPVNTQKENQNCLMRLGCGFCNYFARTHVRSLLPCIHAIPGRQFLIAIQNCCKMKKKLRRHRAYTGCRHDIL